MTVSIAKLHLCDSDKAPGDLPAEADAATCKLRSQYVSALRRVPPDKATIPSAPNDQRSVPEAVPGQSIVVPMTFEGQERSYQIYWPKSHPLTDKLPVVFAGEGLSSTSSNPARHLGVQDGLFAQAEEDGFAVVTPQPKRTDWFGLGLLNLHFWNTRNSVLGFDPEQQDDAKYAAAVQSDMSKNFNVDPSHDRQFCVGFSNGGQLCRTMDVKAVALDASTKLDNEPQTKPGISALIIHGQDDHVLPYEGGVYGPYGLAGFNIWWVQHHLPNGQFDHSMPSSLLQDYVQANNLSSTETADTPYFQKRAYGSPLSQVRAVEYQIKPPYGGHNYNGGHAKNDSGYAYSANTNVIPRRIFDATHLASCFFGLRKNADCQQEGADN